tara:strand:+ start:73 stop:645 length:573 start_codon:yes stop_codon:yes gene_type:complete
LSNNGVDKRQKVIYNIVKQEKSLATKEHKMTQTAEKTDVQLAEEWHEMQMNAKANGNKIYRVIVQQQVGYELYQASFLEDGFRNKTEVKDFYYGDGCGGNRHFGNAELFKNFSCFYQESSDYEERLDCEHVSYKEKFLFMHVTPVRYTQKNKGDYYGTKTVHPDWTLIGTTNKLPRRNNNIKLISITEWK